MDLRSSYSYKPLNKALEFFEKVSFPVRVMAIRHKLFSYLGYRPILVYTMGKVGSTSVYKSLLDYKVSPIVYHVHFLTRSNLDRIVEKYSKRMNSPPKNKVGFKNIIDGTIDHVTASSIVARCFYEKWPKKWIIITLVRDPVALFLSHTFQNPHIHRPFLINAEGSLDKDAVESYIYNHFNNFNTDKDISSNWFKNEFYKFTNVDVYEHEYNVSEGYAIIWGDRFDIAIISLMHLEDNLPKIIHKLTNIEKEVKVSRKNVRELSDDQGIYQDLKKRIVIPVDVLEKVYSTKSAKHFFSAEDRNQMIEKWSKPRG